MSTNNEVLALKKCGIGASHPRIRILQYLRENRTHPTVDEIYIALHESMPSLSKMTVYNSLNVFMEHGLCRDVRIEEGQVRYDAFVDDHGHFKCEKCSKVIDFSTPPSIIADSSLKGSVIKQTDVFVRGICPDCKPSV